MHAFCDTHIPGQAQSSVSQQSAPAQPAKVAFWELACVPCLVVDTGSTATQTCLTEPQACRRERQGRMSVRTGIYALSPGEAWCQSTHPCGPPQPTWGSSEGAPFTRGCELIVRKPLALSAVSCGAICAVSVITLLISLHGSRSTSPAGGRVTVSCQRSALSAQQADQLALVMCCSFLRCLWRQVMLSESTQQPVMLARKSTAPLAQTLRHPRQARPDSDAQLLLTYC